MSDPPGPPPPAEADPIGSAEMAADGTLHLYLRAEGPGGIIGDSLVVYQQTDPEYRDILKHIGPIRPGQSVPVRPWPD